MKKNIPFLGSRREEALNIQILGPIKKRSSFYLPPVIKKKTSLVAIYFCMGNNTPVSRKERKGNLKGRNF